MTTGQLFYSIYLAEQAGGNWNAGLDGKYTRFKSESINFSCVSWEAGIKFQGCGLGDIGTAQDGKERRAHGHMKWFIAAFTLDNTLYTKCLYCDSLIFYPYKILMEAFIMLWVLTDIALSPEQTPWHLLRAELLYFFGVGSSILISFFSQPPVFTKLNSPQSRLKYIWDLSQFWFKFGNKSNNYWGDTDI